MIIEEFNDSVGLIADMHFVVKEKPQTADFSEICALFEVSDAGL